MKRHFQVGLLIMASVVMPFLAGCRSTQRGSEMGQTLLVPRPLPPKEQANVIRSISDRFGAELPVKGRAAGPFRFINTEDFLYVDRTDVGSVAFSLSQYGTSDRVLDTNTMTTELLLPRLEAVLKKSRLQLAGHRFAGFQDEFVGSVLAQGLPANFDPRSVSRLVARTASFDRYIDEIPVFGSELLVGIMPSGNIGRLRVHWPKVNRSLVKEAKEMQKKVRENTWVMPESMHNEGIEIIEIKAGIAHTGFADPGFEAHAATRITFRKVAAGTAFPITSTGYKYYDKSGRELQLRSFPEVPGTPAEEKPTVGK
jgi:hypothetical protein